MSATTQFKVNQLAKDLNLKAKDLTNILESNNLDIKSQKTLEANEFNILMEKLTRENQIKNIEDYIDGVTYIPSAPKIKEKETAKDSLQVDKAKKPVVKKDDVFVTSSEEKQKAATRSSELVADKTVTKAVAEKETNKATAQSPTVHRSHQNTPTPNPTPVNNDRHSNATPPQQRNFGNQQPLRSFPTQQQRPPQNQEARQQNSNWQRPRPNDGQRPTYNNQPRTVPNDQQRTVVDQSKPNFTNQPRPYTNNQQRPNFNSQPRPYTSDPQKPRTNGYQNQQSPYRSNNNFSSNSNNNDTSQNAPRPKYQPQPIVRSQTPKGGTTGADQKSRGAVRVVDTRGSTVDLAKFDERLDTFVPDAVKDARGGNQKLKKQNNATNTNTNTYQRNSRFKSKYKKQMPVKKQTVHVSIPDEISVGELASRLGAKSGELIKRLMLMGAMATVNEVIDYDTAYLISDELGAVITKEVVVTIEEKLFCDDGDNLENLVERAPVVCVMGHVDHGKTSLLDAIRNTHVTTGEAGGITQHIGAYRVSVNGKDLTFLDTPGHEAFTAMRARGAQSTDIAILVVAADDGIMPQTIEAINHAKSAGIDIIVAINKMDKPGANPDNIKQELTKYDLVPEEWGGDVICVPVSALTHMGIENLLENVLLVAEVKELRANPNCRAKGIVIEAKLDKGRGPVATVLVQNGTLQNGDIIIAGTSVGRVRAMTDHNGNSMMSAAPSVPVEITGLSEVPLAGDEFNAVEDERMARELADNRRNNAKEQVFTANARANLTDLFAQIEEGIKDLNIIVKADVGGSAEAVKSSLEKITNEEARVKVVHSAVGGITEGDVMFAAASNSIIIGFNVRPDKQAMDSAERQGVEIRTYRVIYECIEEIKAAMKGMLTPKFKEVINGHAEVRQTIHIPNIGTIAGCYIQDGKVIRNNLIRVLRDGTVIFEDKISSLRRFKDDVKEVATGYECGIGLERFNDIRVGDILEIYSMVEIER